MKIPNAHLALVTRDKIVDYLLNPAHPDNGGKAEFFTNFGFVREEWDTLAKALRGLVAVNDFAESLESPHGIKYILIGKLETPCGRKPTVQTIWIIDRGRSCPRLVTAYPAEA